MGDINSNMLNVNPQSKIVNDILTENGLKLVPHGAANVGLTSETGIDVCICDEHDQIIDVFKTDATFINNHFLIGFSIFNFTPTKMSESFAYRKIDSIKQEDFITHLNSHNWDLLSGAMDLDSNLHLLENYVMDTLNNLASLIMNTEQKSYKL